MSKPKSHTERIRVAGDFTLRKLCRRIDEVRDGEWSNRLGFRVTDFPGMPGTLRQLRIDKTVYELNSTADVDWKPLVERLTEIFRHDPLAMLTLRHFAGRAVKDRKHGAGKQGFGLFS